MLRTQALGGLTNLMYLDLPNNHINATIPASFGALTKLGTLRLSVNRLYGRIPAELGKIRTSGLKISLDQNYLTGCSPGHGTAHALAER